MKKQRLLNTYVNNMNMQEVMDLIVHKVRKKEPTYVVEVNVDVIMKIEKDPYLKQIADEADLTLVDGQPLMWLSKWQGKPLKEKISGSDLVPELVKRAAEKNCSVYILGGMGDAAEKAAENVKRRYPGIRIAGAHSPSWGFEQKEDELEALNEKIRETHPDILLACFGCPKQEKWVYENYKKTGAMVTLCAGATVDFLAGNVKRAPKFISDHGLEWFYRFLKEPKRLFRRYFIEDMGIVKLIWKYRKEEV